MLADLKSITAYYHLDDKDLSDSLRPYLEMAILITNSEISYISTFDDEWQYFLSAEGMDTTPLKRSTSICNVTLQGKEPIVIENMPEDPRTEKQYSQFGFYIGVPIINKHESTLGTFCVLGLKPKSISKNERDLLVRIGNQIVGFLERRHELKHYYDIWNEGNVSLQEERKKIEGLKSKIAHDLKGPLGSLKQANDLALEGGLNSINEYITLFEQSQSTIDHLMQMMQGLTEELLFEKSKEEKKKSFELINLHKFIGSVLDVNKFEDKYPNSKIDVSDSFYFNGPYLDLFIVFQNLIENSLKYNDSEKRQVTIHALEIDTNVQFIVKDNGLGIPKDKQSTIFEKGERAHAESEIQGTGLGLYNVREILSKYAGTIQVSSDNGSGSSFTIELPNSIQ